MSEDGGAQIELPPGWALTTLEALTANSRDAMTDGPFGSRLKSSHYVASGVRVIRLGNIGIGEFKHEDESYVSEAHASGLTRHSVQAGDLVIAALAEPVGRCCQVPPSVPPAIVKADCVRLRPNRELSPGFIMHWLNSPAGAKNAERHSHGVGRLRVNMQEMRSLAVLVAPRREQDRIVAEIEKQFTRLDEAVATLKAVQVKLKRARASVLKAAAEGGLVPTEAELARAEGRSYEPASTLLERILAERRARWPKGKKYQPPAEPKTDNLPELPEGWAWTGLDSLLLDIQAGKSFACDPRPPGPEDVGIVKVSAVTWGTYDEAESKTCSDLAKVNRGYFIQPGDFLFSRANTIDLVGACVIVEQTTRRIMLSDKILRLVFVSPAQPQWVLHVLRSRHGRREIEALSTGNQESMRNIGQDRIRCIALPLPPAAEQTRIVAEVERRLSVIDNLEHTVEQNIARCGRLRQSILKRAFEGKLVPQDPADEPASRLLERIRDATGSRAGSPAKQPDGSGRRAAASPRARQRR